jgi:hypothetical protein
MGVGMEIVYENDSNSNLRATEVYFFPVAAYRFHRRLVQGKLIAADWYPDLAAAPRQGVGMATGVPTGPRELDTHPLYVITATPLALVSAPLVWPVMLIAAPPTGWPPLVTFTMALRGWPKGSGSAFGAVQFLPSLVTQTVADNTACTGVPATDMVALGCSAEFAIVAEGKILLAGGHRSPCNVSIIMPHK